MKPRIVALCVAGLLVFGCGHLYDDSGEPDPASWWPWVCEDGGLAPESGCPAPAPDCDDAGVAPDGACLPPPTDCDDAGVAPDGACLTPPAECDAASLEPDGACPAAASSCADGEAADGDTDGGC